MSRTFKDVPRRVIEARNLKAGRMVHDHTAPRSVDRTSSFADRELSKTFYKKDQKDIRAYLEYLDSLGEDFTYKVEERPGQLEYSPWNPAYSYEIHYAAKTIVISVYRRVRYYETSYCTDEAHYDKATNTDTRDGGRVKCYADYENPDQPGFRRYRCSCCDSRPRPARATVKNRLTKLVREANGAGLAEDFSDPLIEEVDGPKDWC